MNTTRTRTGVLAAAAMLLIAGGTAAWASDVDVAVVDVAAPVASVTLAPGSPSASITLTMTVTGAQDGIATFDVNRDWTLNNGVFTGSNPQTFTSGPRATGQAAPPPAIFTTTGTIAVASGQQAGTFTLAAAALNITNTNTTGAKLVAGDASAYVVTVAGAPPPPADTTPPTIGYVLNPASPDGDNGWYRNDVTLTWTVTESQSPGSLVKTGCVDQNVTADQAETNYSCSARSAGGSAEPVEVKIKRDATVPTAVASLASPSPKPASSDWYNMATGAPTASFACDDNLSGVATCPPSHTFAEGADQSHSGVAKDNAGNSSAPAGFSGINVDLTGPTVAVTGVAGGGIYTLGNVPTAGCTTTDATSGVQSAATLATTGGSANGVGSFTATCSGAVDNAGNTGVKAVTYTVNYGGVSGILQPINPDNTSIFKRGQAVPVKFMLAGDEYTGFDTGAWTIKRLAAPCGGFDADDAIVESVSSNTPATTFRYDSSADQYIYNADMKTTTVGSCYMFRVTLDSGQVLDSAIFKMAK